MSLDYTYGKVRSGLHGLNSWLRINRDFGNLMDTIIAVINGKKDVIAGKVTIFEFRMLIMAVILNELFFNNLNLKQ